MRYGLLDHTVEECFDGALRPPLVGVITPQRSERGPPDGTIAGQNWVGESVDLGLFSGLLGSGLGPTRGRLPLGDAGFHETLEPLPRIRVQFNFFDL